MEKSVIAYQQFNIMAQYKDLEDLPIWKEVRALAKKVYVLTNKGSFKSDRGLSDQVQHTIMSVGSNVVEGFDKSSDKDFANFLTIAKASVAKVRSQLYSALDFGYISEPEQIAVNRSLKDLGSQIGGFLNYLRNSSRTNRRSPSAESDSSQ